MKWEDPPLSEKFKRLRGGDDANLLSRVVDKLVICTAEYFPITRGYWVWDDEIAR